MSARAPQRVKTVSLHYKRRRADAVRDALDESFSSRAHQGPNALAAWLADHGLPGWTADFEVRRARTRFHYKVVAVSR